MKTDIIDRPAYLNRIVSLLDKGMMIILTGQRRVGKSCMLQCVRKHIEHNCPDAHIVYVNKEYAEFESIRDWRDLYRHATANMPDGGRNYLLVDELQDIEDFERALRSLQAEGLCQIIATGSNAKMLSSELATLLSGRFIEVPIYSLSYTEFLLFHEKEDSDLSMMLYLKYGGLPGLSRIGIDDETSVKEYLQNIYNTIILRDIISRENIRNITFLENLVSFLSDNVGRLISVSGISGYMKSQRQDVSAAAVSNYLRFLANAYIICGVRRYDIHGKRLFELIGKYYFEDLGLRNLLCGFNVRGSIERLIENAVWQNLISRGYDVSIGVLRAGEIDFVATRGSERKYIQATYLLGSEETIEREFGNLRRINDNYEKIVVSLDPVSGELTEYPGIKHVHLRDFLSQKD